MGDDFTMINLKIFLKKHLKVASLISLLATLAIVASNIETIINASQKVSHLFKENADIVAIKKDLSSDDIALHIDAANEIEKFGTLSEENAKRAIALLCAFLESPKAKGRDGVKRTIQVLSVILRKSDEKKWSIDRPIVRNADLSGLDLNGIYFPNVRFENVSFENSRLNDSNFNSSVFAYTKFKDAQARNSSLISASISYTCLEGVDLSRAHMEKLHSQWSDYNSANLNEADLSGAIFEESTVRDATFNTTNLSAAHLESILELTNEQLNKASSTKGISLPVPLFQKKKMTICKG